MTHLDLPERARIVVMTGGTSGIGADALAGMADQGDTAIIVGARGANREVPAGVHTLPLDLSSLQSVRDFARDIRESLAGRHIDALVLNAAVQLRRTGPRTVDGFETTFAVNHLAHYLLVRLLTPLLAEGGRVVLTTSDTHDPSLVPFAPRRIDPQALAHPRGRRLGLPVYAASKLCNLQTARALADQDEIRSQAVTVVAYNPGLTAGTNLFIRGPRAQRVMAVAGSRFLRLLAHVKPAFSMGTRERAGEVLAQLATGEISPPPGRVYASLVGGEVTYPDPAPLALDDAVRDDLWRQSAVMVAVV